MLRGGFRFYPLLRYNREEFLQIKQMIELMTEGRLLLKGGMRDFVLRHTDPILRNDIQSAA